jgi:hypothetical protein
MDCNKIVKKLLSIYYCYLINQVDQDYQIKNIIREIFKLFT